MKIIAGKIKIFSGEVIIWPGTVMGYLPQDEAEALRMERTVIEEFRSSINMEEGEARTYLHRMLFKGEDVFKQVGSLSYGERIKLVLVKLMASGVNTLLLDEPTSHMDIDSMERLEEALCEFTGGLLVITHDRYFMEKLGIKKIYIMEKGFLRVSGES
jgi:ATPase subunit of ABC transporter with duplicated ATPase domains